MAYHPILEIELSAPIEKVWALLEDFENYHTWNSLLCFDEPLVVGKTSPMLVEILGRKIKTPVKALKIEKDKELRWVGGPKGLIQGEHYFLLEAIDENRCKLIQGEKFSGLVMPFLWPVLRKTLSKLYKQTNEDIKTAVEA